MEFCSRCDGGAIHAPNCPMCGGSGFVDSQKGASASAYSVPSPFHNNASAARLAREEEKRRSVKVYRAKGSPQKESRLGPKTEAVPAIASNPHSHAKQAKTRRPQPKSGKAKEASGARITNTALADQLSALKSELVLAPAKPAKKRKKKRRSPKSRENPVLSAPRLSRPKPRKNIPFIPVVNGKVSVLVGVREKSESRFATSVGPMRAAGAFKSDLPFNTARDEDEPQGTSRAFQEHHQEEDGSRYMGHSFREESGRFGSLPLHDNLDEIDDY
ncbi:hypothetical protein [Vreelandella hamiltonii]|uniref:Uncharacterized protein n=2 Tax=Bacteria TaxID=2 RepID=A0A8H9IQN0_9GAMM|nr:hypothetical protein [Halomonas hamiltonii]GHD54713.1 hypothetical protein GCM10007157_03500 [Halomonas hamiltonii]